MKRFIFFAVFCAFAIPAGANDVDLAIWKRIIQLGSASPRGLEPSPYFITFDPDWDFQNTPGFCGVLNGKPVDCKGKPLTPPYEQAAVSGYSWVDNGDSAAVGGAFRAMLDNGQAAFGIATEANGTPWGVGHLIGAEFALASRNAWDSKSARWGINIVYKNRADGNGPVESGIGANRYNENAVGIMVTAQGRSSVGEYSGFQRGIVFEKDSLDRSATKPYAAAIDVAGVNVVDAPWYLVVFKCAALTCGLKATANGLEVWEDIEGHPHLVRTL